MKIRISTAETMIYLLILFAMTFKAFFAPNGIHDVLTVCIICGTIYGINRILEAVYRAGYNSGYNRHKMKTYR